MRRYLRSILSIAVLVVLPPSAWADSEMVVAVADFKTISLAPETGQATAEIFRTEVIGSAEYRVVERAQLSQILEELKLSMTGLTPESSIQIGKISPVTHLVLGSLVKLGRMITMSIRVVNTEDGLSLFGTTKRVANEDGLYDACAQIALELRKGIVKPIYTASAARTGSGPGTAFDGQTGTSWMAPAGTFEGWIQATFPSRKEISKVSFYGSDGSMGTGIPKWFTVEHFQNGRWQTILEERKNRRAEWSKSFAPVVARMFRIRVQSVIRSVESLQIAEIRFQ